MSGTIVPSDGSPQSLPRIPMHAPVVESHGILAHHDVACAVCWEKPAMLMMNNGVFWPCDECRAKGWETVRFKWKWLQRWFHERHAQRSRR